MKIAKFIIPCLLLLSCPTSLKAEGNDLALAYLFGYGGYGGGYRGATTTYNQNPPYFAMHPPVYYGERYARPYGASPFAAWPQLRYNADYAPQRDVSRAQVICNPYTVEEVVAPSEDVVQAAPVQPLKIDNPYFNPEVRYTSAKE
jgi:hypothetical protein